MNRQLQSYYTKSDPIVNYMVDKLELQPGDTVFEPCGGDGVFIDRILSINENLPVSVFELDPDAILVLNKKYHDKSNIKIKQTDTLLEPDVVCRRLRFSKIIGNPPYGAKNDEEKQERLNKIYKGIYSKESYTLFLYACLLSLQEKGRLSFIIPDTFLTLHRHKAIRQMLLSSSKIDEILLFPSSFFPGVNFGYANLCIITLERCFSQNESFKNVFTIRKDFNSVNEIMQNVGTSCLHYSQKQIYDNIESSFLITENTRITSLVNDINVTKIGDIADCVTGFYSGNDKVYLHPANNEIKNAKKYTVADKDKIFHGILSDIQKKKGIESPNCLVPVVKGGNKKYVKKNEWYMDWSTKAIQEYQASKKCRFQNPSYYFKEGIAIPMIRSNNITASLINYRLFDQSIVGVFPHDKKLTYYLLAFFNSKTCSKIINTINPSTNNSANYIKQIPFLLPTNDILSKINNRVEEIISLLKNNEEADISFWEFEIDLLLEKTYFI